MNLLVHYSSLLVRLDKRNVRVFIAALFLMFPVIVPAQSRYLRVHYLQWVNSGSTGRFGDCMYYEFPGSDGVVGTADDQNLLLDGGTNDGTSSALARFLDEKIGAGGTIHHMLLSHAHEDHYEGLKMAADRYQVLNYYENVRWTMSGGYGSLIDELNAQGTDMYTVDAGDWLSGPQTNVGPGWDPFVTARVLCAKKSSSIGGDENAWSVVVQIRCGESVFLAGGDATGSATEYWLLNGIAPHSYPGAEEELADTDIYKVHHHGSSSSSYADFMDCMQPVYAIVQVGYGSGDHPYAEALERIWDAGAIVYRNDLDGTVLVKCDDLGNYDITRSRVYVNESSTPGGSGDLRCAPPGRPRNLYATSVGRDYVSLTWDAVSDAFGYDVFRSSIRNGDPGAGRDANPECTATGIYQRIGQTSFSQFTDSGLEPGNAYHYRVSAKKVCSSGGYQVCYERRYSNQASVTTGVVTPTPTPSPTPVRVLGDSGDYDGDGSSDVAIFRSSSGLWAIRGMTRFYFGSPGDLPVSGDYDGDGTTDSAVFRPAAGMWAVRGVTRFYLGLSADLPLPGDYDGDGRCEAGVFRKSQFLWAIAGMTRLYYGSSEDHPVPGYYSGARSKLVAVLRPSTGQWAIRDFTRFYFGATGDRPVAGGYREKNRWEAGIYRLSDGMWAIREVTRAYFGTSSDIALSADYGGDGTDDISVFRPSTGMWAVRDFSKAYFGETGDLPVSARVCWLVTPTPPPTPSPRPSATATPPPTATPTSTPAVPTATPTPGLCTVIDEHFDGYQNGVRPPGWTFSGCDQNTDTYTAAGFYGQAPPSLKFDGTGDAVATAPFAYPGHLTFWIKGQDAAPTSHLLVEEYFASSWNSLTDLYAIPGWSPSTDTAPSGMVCGPFGLNLLSTRVRFAWTDAGGALAFDDVRITCLPTPSPSPVSPP